MLMVLVEIISGSPDPEYDSEAFVDGCLEFFVLNFVIRQVSEPYRNREFMFIMTIRILSKREG